MARKKAFNKTNTLAKAMHLFWEQGYEVTSANDLVRELKLSRSSLYSTYGNKHTLFLKTLQNYLDVETVKLLDVLDSCKNARKSVEKLFKLVCQEGLKSKSPNGCFMVNSAIELPLDNEVIDFVCLHQERLEDKLKNVLKKGQKEGSFSKKVKPKVGAKFLFKQLTALQVSLKYEKDEGDLTQFIKVALLSLE